MSWQGWLSLGSTVLALAVLTLTRVGPHIVMMSVLTVLSALGVLSASEALSGFSNSGVITVAAMFVVAAGIHASGGVDIIVHRLLGRPKSVRSALTRIFLPVTLLSAFLNNTPVVATMIPAINVWARKIGISPSKLMIPLSYTAILGGTLTLIGTSTNLVVNGQYQALTGRAPLTLFSVTEVSLPVAAVGLLFMWFFFPRLLPNAKATETFGDMREFTLEVRVAPKGPLVGKTIVEAGLRHLGRVYLAEIERQGTILTAVSSEERLKGGDRLVFAGDTEAISDLLRINGIVPSTGDEESSIPIADRLDRRLVEAVVSPRCSAVGHAIREARFRDRYGAVVLAVARNGDRVPGNLGSIVLQAGDTLLLEARPAFVSRQRYNKDFLLVNDLDAETPRHDKAYLAWAILLVAVGAAATEVVSMLNAALIAAGLMLITGCVSASRGEKSVDLMVLTTIAASFALGIALEKTGAAAFIAGRIVSASNGVPWLMLALTIACVSLMTETITNNAAAVLMLPIVLQMTTQAGLNQEPFVFAVMLSASASFATPLGYQTNLMVYGPGRYRFSDFLKVGIPMNLVIGMTTFLVLLWRWPLQG